MTERERVRERGEGREGAREGGREGLEHRVMVYIT